MVEPDLVDPDPYHQGGNPDPGEDPDHYHQALHVPLQLQAGLAVPLKLRTHTQACENL